MTINTLIMIALPFAMNVITFLVVFLITDATHSILASMLLSAIFTAVPLIVFIKRLTSKNLEISLEKSDYVMLMETENALLKRKIISMENGQEPISADDAITERKRKDV